MIPELGHFSLILALCFSLLLMTIPLLGVYLNKPDWVLSYRSFVFGQFLFTAVAYLILAFSFLSDDFTVLYVANNSSLALPWFYKLCAVWGAHEGSMLLWVSILSLWTLFVTLFKGELDTPFLTHVLAVLAFIGVGFYLFLLTTSNPFLRYFASTVKNGADLNPLLQDPGFLFHPPMLYMGYVGFAVAFAFAIASLIAGRVDTVWAKWARPWTLAAWCCLTAGITLGSWWAYRELGWGGWWFWDPVENASFMPWLAGTALIHSLAVTEKRKAFKAWTVLLALVAFSLSLLGTFLVRSGVLTSVHAFAVSPGRGLYMLIFLMLVIGLSLFVYALRANTVKVKIHFSLISRETGLMLNNVFLTVTMLTVLLGTLYPLLIDALGLGKLSVGAPYFNQMFIMLVCPLLFFMGLGPASEWREMTGGVLFHRIQIALVSAIFFAFVLPLFIMGSLTPSTFIGVSLGLWIILSTLHDLIRRLKAKKGRLPRAVWGMVVAHIGVAVATLGITLSTQYGLEKDVRMQVGDKVALSSYTITLKSLSDVMGPNYKAVDGRFIIQQGDETIASLHPEKRIYDVSQMAMTDSDIDPGIFRDIYIALGEPLPGNAWSVRLYYKPFVRWIWAGGFFILLGGLLSMTDRHYYMLRRKTASNEALIA
jgi:cytochrome c-type biogenesis protein CcmF